MFRNNVHIAEMRHLRFRGGGEKETLQVMLVKVIPVSTMSSGFPLDGETLNTTGRRSFIAAAAEALIEWR